MNERLKLHSRKRFYLPRDFEPHGTVHFTRLGGQTIWMPADTISCFEEFCLPYCLRKFVEVFQVRGGSHVVLETRAEIEAYLEMRKGGSNDLPDV